MKPQDIIQRISDYIYDNVGKQDWHEHTDGISAYLAAGLQMKEKDVRLALNMSLEHKDIINDIDRELAKQMKQEKKATMPRRRIR